MTISLKERFKFKDISILLFVGLILYAGIALFNTIWSLFLDSFLHNASYVGLFTTVLSIIALIAFVVFIPIIEKYQENKIFFYSLIFSIIILLLYSIVKSFYIVAILALIYVMFSVLRIESFGIMFRNESKTKVLGKNEGLIYTLSNIGWMIGPLIGAFLLSYYNFPIVFIVIALLFFISLLIFTSYKHTPLKYKIKDKLLKNIKLFFKNKDLKHIYLSAMGMPLWWGFIFIYIPLYMVRQGLEKNQVGLFFFALMLPLLIEFMIGKKSDKLGTKSFITSGYFIIAIFAIIAFILNNVYLVLLALVLASFGIAFVEPTSETHFFKLISKKEEEKYYGIYLTNLEVGILLGQFIPAILLFLMPFKYIFIIIAAIMFIFALISLNLKRI